MADIVNYVDIPNQTERDEIERLRSTHEYYDIYKPQWEFFVNSYEGGADAIANNIFKHQRENEDAYYDRIKRAHYLNYCVCPGELVRTSTGMVPIEDVKIGDLVLTHTGKYQEVVNTSAREVNELLYKFEVTGKAYFTVTSEHPILIHKAVRRHNASKKEMLPYEWLSAKEVATLKKAYVATPFSTDIHDVETIDLLSFCPDGNYIDEDGYLQSYRKDGFKSPKCNKIKRFINVDFNFCQFMGYFFAEGCTSRGRITFASHKKEEPIRKWLRSYLKTLNLDTKDREIGLNGVATDVCCTPLSNFLQTFGKIEEKHFPGFVEKLPYDKQVRILVGYLIGDGSFLTGEISANSCSPTAAFQLQEMSFRCGISCGMKDVNCQDRSTSQRQWKLLFSAESANKLKEILPIDILECKSSISKISSNKKRKIKFFDDRVIGKIRSIELVPYKGKVYNLDVANDHTYTVNGTVVHNCALTIDFYTNFIFSDVIDRDGGPDNLAFSDFIKDVDKRGSSVDAFMHEISNIGRIYGHVFVFVDSPSVTLAEGDVLTAYRAQELGIRPYWCVVPPDEILDWDTDSFGNFIYLKRLQMDISHDQTTGEKKYYEIYREWFADRVRVTVLDITDNKRVVVASKEERPLPIGVLPVVCISYKHSKKYQGMGNSFLRDIASTNRSVLNITSLVDEFLYRQCVTGDTKIDCPRDLEKYPHGIPIKDLIGIEFLTYSWSIGEKRYVLRKAHDVRKTGEQQEVWRLTYKYKDEFNQDKIDFLDATPGHPILLQTGEFVALRDLKSSDKLVPFYRWVDGFPRGNRPHILQGLSPYSGIAEHRFIVRERGERLLVGYEVHHLDERSLNNELNNLQQLTKKEHNKLTAAANSKRKKEWWNTATKEQKSYVTKKALAGIAKWREENPEEVIERNTKQSATIRTTLSRLSASGKKAKVAAALSARGIEVEQVNHAVVSVEFLGYKDVYNMEVEGTHNYVANGIVVHNCFNILAKEQDTMFPMQNASQGNVSTSNVVYFPKGGQPPQYITPPADPARFLQEERQSNINEIFRQAVQDLRSDLANGEKSSGMAQSMSFSRTVPFIATWAQCLEDAENKLFRLTWLFNGKKWLGKIKYKDHYELTNLVDSMTNLLMLFKDLALPSKTFAIAELKRLVKEHDGKLPVEDLAKVMQEIDALDFDEWHAEVMSGAGSPAEQQQSKQTGTLAELKKESEKKKSGPNNKLRS